VRATPAGGFPWRRVKRGMARPAEDLLPVGVATQTQGLDRIEGPRATRNLTRDLFASRRLRAGMTRTTMSVITAKNAPGMPKSMSSPENTGAEQMIGNRFNASFRLASPPPPI
jgi:hypothetical protein